MRAGRSEGRNALTHTASRLFSARGDSEAVGAIKKKRKLSPGHRLASPRSLSVAANPERNARILTRFSFAAGDDLRSGRVFYARPIVPFSKLIYDLESVHPRPTAVLVEPSSTSALRRFSLVFATTTKICIGGRYNSGSPRELLCDPRVPPTP